jgi:hypothetical protein
LKLTNDDVLYDVGCGDARFLLAACDYVSSQESNEPTSTSTSSSSSSSDETSNLLQCVGIEYDKIYSTRATALSSASPFSNQITILHADALTIDLTPASALFLYLVPKGLILLKPSLHSVLRRGGRICSYMFSVPGLVPNRVESSKGGCKVYYYDLGSLPKEEEVGAAVDKVEGGTDAP